MSETQKLPPIRFGTDGWRAVIAEDYTFANLERVAQAYADYIHQQNSLASVASTEAGADGSGTQTHRILPLIVVGYDRRFLSEQFAERVVEVLASNGIFVAAFTEAVPTPLVSWAVREQKAGGGIMITASHNPPEFNGFKIKASWGGSAPPETTSAVEALIDAKPPQRHAEVIAAITSCDATEFFRAAEKSYRAQIASYIDLERLRATKARVIVDPMHGAGGLWVESFLKGGTLQVETIRATRDPLFGGCAPEPIDRNLQPLKNRIKETGALIGLATDGDADRVGAVNELGETMTMHEVVPLLLLHLARHRKLTGGVVRTFSQSVLTKRIAAAHNLPLYDTPIGFKYIAELMLKENILIGAEESGGIGVRGHIPERDGILNSLLLLEAVVAAGKTPSEMVRDMHKEFGEFYFGRTDRHMGVTRGQKLVAMLAASPPKALADETVRSVETLDGTKLLFADESWLLFRQSGTEPMLRIYSEATSIAKMNKLLNAGQRLAEDS